VGYHPSVAIGGDGVGLISYNDWTNRVLKVAHCDNVACSTASPNEIASTATARPTSLAIAGDGFGVISYEGVERDLRVARCLNSSCSAVAIAMVETTNAAVTAAITIGMDGLPLISNTTSSGPARSVLKVVHCSNIYCQPYVRAR
jgi:hypothetical protein